MTTLEDRIADLQQQAGLLLDLPQQIADVATARIHALGDYWQQAQERMYARHYVHQLAGDDQADGTETAPLRSVEEAIRRTPVGGICEIRLLADYHFATSVPTGRRHVIMRSGGTVRHRVTLERIHESWSLYEAMWTGGLQLSPGASVEYDGLTLVVPVLDGVWTTYTLVSAYAGHIQCGHADGAMPGMARIKYCDIEIPASPFCPVVGRAGLHTLVLEVIAAVATDQPLTGHLVEGASDPAGTDPATLPWLITNLTQV